MPRQSVFVFEINNKEDEIETEVLNTFRKLKVDTSIPLPWEYVGKRLVVLIPKEVYDEINYSKNKK